MYGFSNCPCTLKGKYASNKQSRQTYTILHDRKKTFFTNTCYVISDTFIYSVWEFGYLCWRKVGKSKCWTMTFKGEIMKMSLWEHNFIVNNFNQKLRIIKTKMSNVFIYFIWNLDFWLHFPEVKWNKAKTKKMQQTFKISNISFIEHVEVILLLDNL